VGRVDQDRSGAISLSQPVGIRKLGFFLAADNEQMDLYTPVPDIAYPQLYAFWLEENTAHIAQCGIIDNLHGPTGQLLQVWGDAPQALS
jgi:hypothetical protein